RRSRRRWSHDGPGSSACTCGYPFLSPRKIPDFDTYRSPSGGRSAEDVDAVALGEGHDGALRVGALAETGAGALALARPVERVDPGDLDLEDRLDGLLDLGLVGARVDDERVLVLVEQGVALLGHDRLDEDVPRVREGLAQRGLDDRALFSAAGLGDALGLGGLGSLGRDARVTRSHQASLPSVSLAVSGPATKDSKAAWVNTTSSETSTSYVFSWPGSRMCTWGRLRAE